MIVLMICLTGCSQRTTSVISNPSFPLPSDDVANELKTHCLPQEKCPAFWEWLDDIYKLKDQLEN